MFYEATPLYAKSIILRDQTLYVPKAEELGVTVDGCKVRPLWHPPEQIVKLELVMLELTCHFFTEEMKNV